MPNTNRNALNEYKDNHIEGAHFFDLDKNSDLGSSIPHMLPSKKSWEKSISNLGIKNSDHIIVYDNSDVISSCRIWYNFLYFGHNPNLISVLDGNFQKWKSENFLTSKEVNKINISNYTANENSQLVLNKDQIIKNIISKKFQLIDARGEQRFLGLQPEPRKELKSGNIKGSKNLPFQELINIKEGRTFKKKEELIKIFRERQILLDQEMAFTCGSGVTACILGLANSIISGKKPIIYDGSWAEYGLE